MEKLTLESGDIKKVHVSCPHDCPDGCSMTVSVDQSTGRAVKVEALDPEGNTLTINAVGLMAIVFQHEIDHLNGILFIDKVTEYTKHPKM